jgi:hypothetical protein
MRRALLRQPFSKARHFFQEQDHATPRTAGRGGGRTDYPKVLEKAKAGDDVCLRMLMDRLWPPRRGQPVKLDTPPLKTSTDVSNVIITLWDAIAEGRLTPDEASALSLVAERSMAVLSHQEILRRIEILEKDRELRDATKSFETA